MSENTVHFLFTTGIELYSGDCQDDLNKLCKIKIQLNDEGNICNYEYQYIGQNFNHQNEIFNNSLLDAF